MSGSDLDMNSTSEESQNMSCEITDVQRKFYSVYSWWLGGIGTIFVASFGLLFNTVAISILCNKRMKESFFNRLLVCLAIVDNLFLTNGIYSAYAMQLSEPNTSSGNHLFIFINILYPARNVLMCSSIYMTVGLACERYISIAKPYLQRSRQSENTCRRLVCYVVPVISLSIVFYIPKFFDLKLIETVLSCSTKLSNETADKNCSTEFSIFPTDIRINNDYILWYINIANLMVTSVVPGVFLTFFNYKIHLCSIARRKRRASMISEAFLNNKERDKKGYETRQTFVLFAIVIMFVICHILRIVLNLEEIVNFKLNDTQRKKGCPGVEFWEMVTLPISGLLLHINSSSNFFIYCIYDNLFKDVLKSQVPYRLTSCRKLSSRQEDAIEMQRI